MATPSERDRHSILSQQNTSTSPPQPESQGHKSQQYAAVPPTLDNVLQAKTPSFDPQTAGSGSPEAYRERRSTYEVVDQLLRDHNSRATMQHTTDAIPGGSPKTRFGDNGQFLTVFEAVGAELPPQHVIDFSIESYVNAVHWFMLLFHEPSLRTELQMILSTGFVRTDRVTFLLLATLVIGVGAKYSSPAEAQRNCPGYDLDALGIRLIRVIEFRLMDIFDQAGIEAVQISIVLASFYLYHGQPKRSLALSGSTLKLATALRIQRESSWKVTDPVQKEVWRGLAWAIYIAEVFTAISHGTPCIIQDHEWDVQLPRDTDETSATCPGFDSLETFEGETFGPVTLGSYQRYKFRLYHIAASITRNVYSRTGTTITDLVKEIKSINDRLVRLEKGMPRELRLRYLKDLPTTDETRWTIKTFQLQALALRLSYDNILLVLHRPLLTMNRIPTWPPVNGQNAAHLASSHNGPPDTAVNVNDMIKTSKYQCWVSAMRTSRIGEHGKILTASRNTHGAAYAGIQTFTAGVVLGIFALSDPLSAQAHQAKRAIGKIIKLPKIHDFRTIVSDQCGTILEELVKIIMAEEMKCLLSSSDSDNVSPEASEENGKGIRKRGSAGATVPLHSRFPAAGASQTVQIQDGDGVSTGTDVDPMQMDLPQDFVDGNFSDALLSLQDVFRDGGLVGYSRPATSSRDPNGGRNLFPTTTTQGMTMAVAERSSIPTRMSNVFETTSQAWIWDDILWLPDGS